MLNLLFLSSAAMFVSSSVGDAANFFQPSPASCRKHIAEITCVASRPPWADQNQWVSEPRCSMAEEDLTRYIEPIQSAFDKMPPRMQIEFCALKQIYIENNIATSGYAIAEINKYGKPQPVLGFRRSLFNEELSASQWASWRDQINFGARLDSYDLLANAPKVEVTAPTPLKASDLAVFHEIAHVYDTLHDVNPFPFCQGPTCDLIEGRWTAFSWQTLTKPKDENIFEGRELLCFYDCGKISIPLSLSRSLYEGVYDTSFTTLYSSTSPWDDFSDLFMLKMVNSLGGQYIVHLNDGTSFNLTEKLSRPQIKEKVSRMP